MSIDNLSHGNYPPKSATKPYVEYLLRIPKPVDELLDKIVLDINSKTNDPSKYVNNEGFYLLIIRDWYANQVLPKLMENVQKREAEKFSADLKKMFDQCYK